MKKLTLFLLFAVSFCIDLYAQVPDSLQTKPIEQRIPSIVLKSLTLYTDNINIARKKPFKAIEVAHKKITQKITNRRYTPGPGAVYIVHDVFPFFDQPVSIRYCWATNGIELHEVSFIKDFTIFNSYVEQDVRIFASVFTKAQLSDNHVYGAVSMRDSKCLEEFSIYESTFYDWVNFDKFRSKRVSSFYGSEFKADAKFRRAHFDSVYFVSNVFEKDVDFEQASFNKLADFSGSGFLGNTSFRGSTLGGITRFDSTLFYGELDFSDVNIIANEIDLTFIRTDTIYNSKRKCVINLLNSDVSKIKIDYQKFRLKIPDKIDAEKMSNVYQQLLFNFKNDGFLDSYRDLDKEYQEYLYIGKNQSPWYNHLFNFLDSWWWDYGYDGGRPIYWSILLVVIFGIGNYFLYEKLTTDVYVIENLPTKIEGRARAFRKAYFSLIYSAFVFFSINVKKDKLKFSRGGVLFYFLVEYTVGIICLAYIANYFIKL